MIRHARWWLAVVVTIPLLAVTVIESSLGTLLVAEVGGPELLAAGLPAASGAAVAMSAVAVGADEKHRLALAPVTEPLS